MTYEQIKSAIEQEARVKYPGIPQSPYYSTMAARKAYVEGKMSMLDLIEKTWDASQKRTNWEFIVPDEAKAPPTKAEYISNLFKSKS